MGEKEFFRTKFFLSELSRKHSFLFLPGKEKFTKNIFKKDRQTLKSHF